MGLAALAYQVAAQEPVFVTPPVTMFREGGLVGMDLERRGGTTTLSADVAYGVLSPWTLALHAVTVDGQGTPPQLARAQLGARLRILKLDRPREWILLSAYGAGALPLGAETDRVAQTYGVARDMVGLSAARMARAGDGFADLALAWIPAPGGTRTAGIAGLALGWRPSPRPYAGAEGQLFAETRAQYLEGGAASVGVAPGILVHTKRVLVKLGVLIPLWTRQTAGEAVLRVGAKALLGT